MLPKVKFRQEEPTYLILVVAVVIVIVFLPQGMFAIGATDGESVPAEVPAERDEP